MNKYLVIDAETTGLDPEKNGIITLSAAIIDDKEKVVSTFDGYNRDWENFECDLQALNVNGFKFGFKPSFKALNNSNIQYFESTNYLLQGFSNYLLSASQPTYIMGMNVRFDLDFIKHAAKNAKINFGKALPYQIIDPMIMAHCLIDAGVLKNIKHVNSKNLYEKFNIPDAGIHASHVDVKLTFELWKKMREMISTEVVNV